MNYQSLLVLTSLAVSLSVTACSNAQPPGQAGNSAPTLSVKTDNSSIPRESTPAAPTVDPQQLIQKITQVQRQYVRDSTGTEGDQCFTDDNFDEFKKQKTTAKITEELKNDKDFIAIVNAIREMEVAKRSALLDEALNRYRKEWRLLKLNPHAASPDELLKGQSTAGMKAEQLIAQTVVELVKKMI